MEEKKFSLVSPFPFFLHFQLAVYSVIDFFFLDIVVGESGFLICFSTEFMILYLLSSVVFSMLKSARPSNFS